MVTKAFVAVAVAVAVVTTAFVAFGVGVAVVTKAFVAVAVAVIEPESAQNFIKGGRSS